LPLYDPSTPSCGQTVSQDSPSNRAISFAQASRSGDSLICTISQNMSSRTPSYSWRRTLPKTAAPLTPLARSSASCAQGGEHVVENRIEFRLHIHAGDYSTMFGARLNVAVLRFFTITLAAAGWSDYLI